MLSGPLETEKQESNNNNGKVSQTLMKKCSLIIYLNAETKQQMFLSWSVINLIDKISPWL